MYGSQIVPLDIVRPPIVLIHGLWGDADSWNSVLNSLTTGFGGFGKLGLYVKVPKYDEVVPGIVSSNPMNFTGSDWLNNLRANSFGFAYNAPGVLDQITNAVKEFRTSVSVAAARVDVIAHSMGGDITRALPQVPAFNSIDSYGQGPIHKVITVGTPHLGSPLAALLLQSANTCVSQHLADQGLAAAASFQSSSGTQSNGAVGDLVGDGRGGGLSPALTSLAKSGGFLLPTAFIAGVTDSTNLNGLDQSGLASYLRCVCGSPTPLFCSTGQNNPLANDLTTSNWNSIFNQAQNDAIVPLTSAFNNEVNIGYNQPGLVHSQGTEQLGFSGPNLLDSTDIINELIVLLNTPVSNTRFFTLLP